MAIKVKKGGMILLAIIVIAVLYGLKSFFMDSSWALKHKDANQTQLVSGIVLPDAPKTSSGDNVIAAPMPDNTPSTTSAKSMTIDVMAWNAQMGLMFANGGSQTAHSSLMEKHNVQLNINRQDDCNQMQKEMLKFASDYKDNPDKATGTNFCIIMGDGAAAWFSGIQPQLEKLGPDYKAQIVCATGKSNGEDKLMGPQSWKDNPQNAKGGVVSGVIRDGDWNIAVKWCSDNGIPVNPDEKTYDPSALNFISADDYMDAAKKYISNYKETRDEVAVENGKTVRTGKRRDVKADGVVTWTPGDVLVAQEKGGIVPIVSTAEYSSQMPAVVIGINKFMQDNRKEVEGMIQGITEGGDQVKTFGDALQKAGDISSRVYKDKDAAYWIKYYRGVHESDKTGRDVSLGGSRAFNLSDNIALFGLGGGGNVYAAVYKVFGDIVSKLYPKLVPTYPIPNDVVDMTYLSDLKNQVPAASVTTGDKVQFNTSDNISEKVSKRAWSIEFITGSASFTPKAKATLNDLYDQLVVAGSLRLEIHGYTDNVGNESSNVTLSQARANAVKSWLIAKSADNFPQSRFSQVQGHGDADPVADNATETGKAQNRRVEIIMGK